MFWKFDLHTTSHIDTLLEKEDVTLTEVMDEEDVLQECKAQNRKLVDFLVRPQCMEDLVTFITQEPGNDMDEKLKYKWVGPCSLILQFYFGCIDSKTMAIWERKFKLISWKYMHCSLIDEVTLRGRLFALF